MSEVFDASVGSADAPSEASLDAALGVEVRAVLSDLLTQAVAPIDWSDVTTATADPRPFTRGIGQREDGGKQSAYPLCSLIRPSDPTEAARRLWDAVERNGVAGIPMWEALTAVCNHNFKPVSTSIQGKATLSSVRQARCITAAHDWVKVNHGSGDSDGKRVFTAAIADDQPQAAIDAAVLSNIAARCTALLLDALAPIRWDTDVRSVVDEGLLTLDPGSSVHCWKFPAVAPDRVSEYLRPSDPPLAARRLFTVLVRTSFGGLTVADALAAVTGGDPVDAGVQTCVIQTLRIGSPPATPFPLADVRRMRAVAAAVLGYRNKQRPTTHDQRPFTRPTTVRLPRPLSPS